MTTTSLEARIRPAYRSAALVAALTLAGVYAAAIIGFPPSLRIGLALIVACYGAWTAYRLIRPAWRSIRLRGDTLRLISYSDTVIRGELRHGIFVSPLFASLRWAETSSSRSRRIGLFREQLAADDFRRLAAILRIGGGEQS